MAIASGAPCLVVVDPLEELWTACRDERERLGFADRLVELAGQRDVAVVACMRSDFLGRVAEHPGLAAAIGNGTLLVSEMTADELRRAVEGPARRRGLDVEPALVDTAVREVAGRPGALPLLSTALLATWERRTGPVLILAAYREAGGVASALAGLADGCYDALEPETREAARRILLRLASDENGTDVRVRTPVADLTTGPEAVEALDALVQRRLVTIDGDDAEIAHEALLREWPRLREWLDEDREGRRVQRALSNATQDWVTADRDDDLLFRGTRLAAALETADARPAEITPLEHEFLGASRAHQDAELRSAQRTAHRLRRLAVGMALLLVVALIAVGFSLVQRSHANDNADRAEEQATISLAQQLAAESRAAGTVAPTSRCCWRSKPGGCVPGPRPTGRSRLRCSRCHPASNGSSTSARAGTGPSIPPSRPSSWFREPPPTRWPSSIPQPGRWRGS